MSNKTIKVEDLSKQYRIGQIGTGTISHDLNRWWHNIRGKDDPYLKIGDSNDRTVKASSNYVWALQDINFEVYKGDVLGIIGKNGAGKSTLLKILSKVTSPTTGKIKSRGRIASLLEVGTGFHPEMTGRENIFMNGTIMGMNRNEIRSKLDEIVEFAGVTRYLDTPVKRYSSGMTVRLGFAIAAHLEPEILIVDEVLAVGDAEFQKKCLGKMDEVSKNEGRTILFVSHNMGAVKRLCKQALLLQKGKIQKSGMCADVIEEYLKEERNFSSRVFKKDDSKPAWVESVKLLDLNSSEIKRIEAFQPYRIKVTIRAQQEIPSFRLGIGFSTSDEIAVRTVFFKDKILYPGCYEITFEEKDVHLYAGVYKIVIGLSSHGLTFQYVPEALDLEIQETYGKDQAVYSRNGLILNQMQYSVVKL